MSEISFITGIIEKGISACQSFAESEGDETLVSALGEASNFVGVAGAFAEKHQLRPSQGLLPVLQPQLSFFQRR